MNRGCIHTFDTTFRRLKNNLLPIIEEERLPGENFIETLRRVAVHNALVQTNGHQKEAAFLLYTNPRVFNYLCKDLGLRPADRALQEKAP